MKRPTKSFEKDIAKFQPRQMELCAALDKHYKFILFGGCLGGGKSYGLRWVAVRYLIKLFTQKGMKWVNVMLACENYPSLKDRQLQKVAREFPEWLGKSYTDHKDYGRCFILEPEYGNGVICFRNLDDSTKYASSEFAAIFVDELSKNPYDVFTFLRTRLRWPGLEDTECPFVGGTNPGGVGHCVPYGDVLTPYGWKDIKDMKEGDSVYTVDENKVLKEAIVHQKHETMYSGDMVNVNARGLSIVCTPNHSVAKVGGIKNRLGMNKAYSLVPFSKLPGQATILRSCKFEGIPIGKFKIDVVPTRKRKLNQPTELNGVDYAELTGWMLTEGCTIDRDKAFSVTQMKTETKDKIRNLLTRCGFSYGESEKGFLIHAIDWWNYYKQFGKCRDKFIPRNLKSCSNKEMYALFEAMVDGDGCWINYGESGAFYTFSKQLSDDFAEIAVKLGYIVHSNSRQKPNRKGLEYRVDFKRTLSGGTELLTGNHIYNVETETKRKSDISIERYDGYIYCIGIPDTHSFIIRQNGSVWVSGNSWIKALWMDKIYGEEWQPSFDNPVDYRKQFFYIPSKATDNKYLDVSYWAMLDTLPEAIRKAFRDGDWNVFVGQAFQEWNESVHVVTKEFAEEPIPANAPIIMTYDWGFGAPFSIGWWWVDNDNRIYRFDEWYGWNGSPNKGLRMADSDVARAIIAREKVTGIWGRVKERRAGSDCFQKRPDVYGGGQGPSTAEVFRNLGITLVPGDDRSRLAKIKQFRERLRHGPGERPMMMIYPNCKQFIRTIPNLVMDEHNIEDIDMKTETHAYDDACHICMARPLGNVVIEESKQFADNLSEFARLERERLFKELDDVEGEFAYW